jgi:hypothetical protein
LYSPDFAQWEWEVLSVRMNTAPGGVDTTCVVLQWNPNSKDGWSREVVDNTLMPNVPLTGTLEPTNT